MCLCCAPHLPPPGAAHGHCPRHTGGEYCPPQVPPVWRGDLPHFACAPEAAMGGRLPLRSTSLLSYCPTVHLSITQANTMPDCGQKEKFHRCRALCSRCLQGK